MWESTFQAKATSGPYKGDSLGTANDIGVSTCQINKAGTACN